MWPCGEVAGQQTGRNVSNDSAVNRSRQLPGTAECIGVHAARPTHGHRHGRRQLPNERFAGARSRPQVAERERSSAERLDGATANRRIVWRRPIWTQSKSCGTMEPTWRPTVTADDDTDKRGVSDPPIRGGAMIATQEGGRSRPDRLFNGQSQWRQRAPPVPAIDGRYRVATKGA